MSEKRTPQDWAKRQGRYREVNKHIAQARSHYDWRHACADRLHGWSKFAYHYQRETFELSEDDYNAALKAAEQYPNVPAHAPAIPVAPQKG